MMTEMLEPQTAPIPTLNEAPADVQLAVDLIMLLEQHQLEPALVLRALQLVTRDFQRKLHAQSAP